MDITPEQIREIVRITLDELAERKQLKEKSYRQIARETENKLRAFFNKNNGSSKVGTALKRLSDDPYIDVIFLNYRDNVTLERIAEIMHRDVTTVKRHKKRLIMELYYMLEV